MRSTVEIRPNDNIIVTVKKKGITVIFHSTAKVCYVTICNNGEQVWATNIPEITQKELKDKGSAFVIERLKEVYLNKYLQLS